MSIEAGEKFIIQNFRSWEGKNYVELNDLTFLFGANSSGKSSILNALGLIRQSTNEETRLSSSGILDKLIPNGPNVKLDKISGQAFRVAQTKEEYEAENKKIIKDLYADKKEISDQTNTLTSRLLGFGWCWDRHPGFYLETRKDQFGMSILKQFDYKIEVLFYFDNITGENVGLEYRLGSHSVFKIIKEITYNWDDMVLQKLNPRIDDVKFRIECCQDPAFWDKILSSHSMESTMVDYLQSEIKQYVQEGKTNPYGNDAAIIFDHLRSLQNQHRRLKKIKRDIEKQLLKTKVDTKKKELSENLHDVNEELSRLENDIAELGANPNTLAREFAQKFHQQRNKPFMEKISRWVDIENFLQDIKELASFEITDIGRHGEENYKEPFENFTVEDMLLFMNREAQRERWHPENSEQFENFYEQTQLLNVISYLFGTRILNFPRMTRQLVVRFRNTIRSIHQIGPIRQQPERFQKIDINKNVANVGYSAENLMNVLHNLEDTAEVEINKWLKKLEIGYKLKTQFRSEFNIQELILTDEKNLEVAINDVGFGVTQVLPIVVEAVLAKNKLITIEQPELHIHPKLQSNLADLFLWSSAQQHNSFLIETHSEHIMLRLQKHQRDGTFPSETREKSKRRISDMVTINVIEKLDGAPNSQIELLGINSKGGFKGEWPGGFFKERLFEKGLM